MMLGRFIPGRRNRRLNTELVHKVSVLADSVQDQTQSVIDRLDRMTAQVDLIRNGMTVKTGEFEALTRIFTGQKMYVDTRDNSFSPHIMLEGIWEAEITKVFMTQIRPDDVVLDIGANFGYYGILAATNLDLSTGAAVHFIEPNPHLVPLIAKSASINGLIKNSHVEPAAISDHAGSVTFTIVKDQWASSSINDVKRLKQYTGLDYQVEERVKAKLMTVDQYCQEQGIKKVGLMKLDVEGFEDKAFAGMTKIVAASPNLRLFLEFTIDAYEDPKAFFKQLQSSFEVIQVIERGSGNLILVKSYQDMVKASYDRWAMLLLANQAAFV